MGLHRHRQDDPQNFWIKNRDDIPTGLCLTYNQGVYESVTHESATHESESVTHEGVAHESESVTHESVIHESVTHESVTHGSAARRHYQKDQNPRWERETQHIMTCIGNCRHRYKY